MSGNKEEGGEDEEFTSVDIREGGVGAGNNDGAVENTNDEVNNGEAVGAGANITTSQPVQSTHHSKSR